MKSSVHKTKMNARLAIGQRADLFEANISANKISLPQGHSYTEKEYYIYVWTRTDFFDCPFSKVSGYVWTGPDSTSFSGFSPPGRRENLGTRFGLIVDC